MIIGMATAAMAMGIKTINIERKIVAGLTCVESAGIFTAEFYMKLEKYGSPLYLH
jgi:hypothetical protein